LFVGIQESNLPLFFFVIVMPLFLIVLASSAMGASIALYILRKYDPHTDEITHDK